MDVGLCSEELLQCVASVLGSKCCAGILVESRPVTVMDESVSGDEPDAASRSDDDAGSAR